MSVQSTGDAVSSTAATYTLEEVASLIGKSPALLYRRLTEQSPQYQLRFVRKEGNKWVIPRDLVDDAIARGESILVKVPTVIKTNETLTKEDAVPKELPDGVRKKGRKYYVRKQINGKRLEICAGKELSTAKKLLNILQVYADAGVVPDKISLSTNAPIPVKDDFVINRDKIQQEVEHKKKITFGEAADDLYNNHTVHLTSGVIRKGDFARLKKLFGKDKVLEDISWTEIETVKNKRLSEVKPGTVKRDMILLGQIFERQVRKGKILRNPVKQISPIKFNDARDQILTEEEFESLLSATWVMDNRGYKTIERVKPHLQLALLIADYTGMRLSEILSMTWDNLNMQDGYYFVPKSKNFDKRHVPIHEELMKVLKEIPREGEHIIMWRGKKISGNIQHGFAKAREVAGITDSHFHDTRHRAISRYVQMGFPVNVIMKATGHRTMSAFLRYANLRDNDVMQLVGGKIEATKYVSYEKFMELYKRPISVPVKS